MSDMKKLTLVLVALSSALLQAQSRNDRAVLNILTRSDSRLSDARVWRRVALDDGMDLVVAIGTPKEWGFEEPIRGWVWWGLQRKRGSFLQDRAQPARVFTLSTADGFGDCAARIVRATVTDTLISCEGETSETRPTQKLVYDVRAKRLVSRFAYEPFSEFRVNRARPDGAWFTAATERYEVTVDFSAGRAQEFRVIARAKTTIRCCTSFPEPFQAQPALRTIGARSGWSKSVRRSVATTATWWWRRLAGLANGTIASRGRRALKSVHGSSLATHSGLVRPSMGRGL
jgi:hypothetical protein